MHWTLQLLIILCCACVLLNAAQFAVSRSVRISGMLVCAMWMVQELVWFWWGDSLILFIACDIILWAYFRKAGLACWRDGIIDALIWPTLACGIVAKLDGMSTTIWWLNWSMVCAQMALGLPWIVQQMGRDHYSHGSIKSQEV